MTLAETADIRWTTILVQDLCCTTEELKIRRKFDELGVVHSLQVNFVTHRLTVSHSTDDATLLRTLRAIGLPGSVEPLSRPSEHQGLAVHRRASFTTAACSFAIGLTFHALSLSPLLSTTFFMLTIVAGGWEVALRGFRSLSHRTLDIHVLMSVAVIGAVAIGQYAEGAAVILLYAASLLLESMSMDRTRHAIRSLMKLSPLTATLLRDGTEIIVPSERLAVNDIVRVHPGERIPADGVVRNGTSTVDQSPITGESLPIVKAAGAQVFAGTFNQRGMLEVGVTKPAADSRLAQIVHLVEEAESNRAEHHTFVETFARYYTPGVFLLTLLVWTIPPILLQESFSPWFYRGLVLLVISCPCALVISTPVTLVSAITNAARHGLLIKGGRHLETLGSIRALAIDKTGTLTQARLTVTDVIQLNEMGTREILQIAATLELRSEHHLADAVLLAADSADIPFRQNVIEEFEATPGKGVHALVNGTRYTLGNHQLAEELGVCSPDIERRLDILERRGRTVIILSNERQAIAIIALADVVRAESHSAIDLLHNLGVRPVVLLTGDNAVVAESVASDLGVDEVRAGLLPHEKSEIVGSLRQKYGSVGMIGDGVNDAPALALADVGLAMGAAGSDTAIEAADIVLMSDNLMKVPHGIALGRRAIRTIKQNVVLALVVKGMFLFLGVFGWTSLWLAILADDGVTLAVIMNSLRILRFGSRTAGPADE